MEEFVPAVVFVLNRGVRFNDSYSTISSYHKIVPIRDSSDGGTSGSYDYTLGLNNPAVWWYSSSPWTSDCLVILGHLRGFATWQFGNGTPNDPMQRPAL